MKHKLLLLAVLLITIGVSAQTKNVKKPIIKSVTKPKETIPETKIILGEKEILVKGKAFNEILYKTNLSYQKNKYQAYYYTDAAKKALIITEVYYEIINDVAEARSIETYTLPVDKINKKDSYLLPMEDEYLEGGKYQRLTLINTGVNQQNFTQSKLFLGDEKPTVTKVNNVTINILAITDAQFYLNQFTKP
jgi:hypothetical protein